MRQTLIIIKPDAVNRSLVGKVLQRFEEKGLRIVGMKMEKLNETKLTEHYYHHKDKPFFKELVQFMSSIPSVLVVLEGKDAISVVRTMVGPTNARTAPPGTIRGDFSLSFQTNIIHASENDEAAKAEIKRFFSETELCEYQKADFNSLYCEAERTKVQ
jgi:nucleoside-diphosphate kinase